MRVPRLLVTYRERIGGHRVPIVVLEVIDFDAKRLGITRVVRVCGPPRALGVQAFEAERFARARQLLGKEYTGFPRACQQVYAAICGDKDAHINCMDAFEVYVRGDFDPFLLGTWCERKEKHGEEIVERFSPMLAAAVAKTFDEPPAMRPHSPTAQWEGWITVGEGRPYSHINTPPQSVEAAVQRMMREGTLSGPQRPRDLKKRSRAEPDPLEEGEVRHSKKPNRPNSGSRRKKEHRIGRLVFLATHVRARIVDYADHPHVVVGKGPCMLGGTQAVMGVRLRPLPEYADLPEVTFAVKDVIGLTADFESTWRMLPPGRSLLRDAMLEAVERFAMSITPAISREAVWKELMPCTRTAAEVAEVATPHTPLRVARQAEMTNFPNQRISA